MSYFLNIYMLDHSSIKGVLNSSAHKTLVDELMSSMSSDECAVLEDLMNKNYTRDPDSFDSDDAPDLIYMLEKICGELSQEKEVIEFSLDEDELPVLFDFPFSGWDDDDFALPVSPSGTPAVVYRDATSLESYLEKFQALEGDENYDTDYLSHDELSLLIEITKNTLENNTGMFIFCSQ